jgi:hypothetical protein
VYIDAAHEYESVKADISAWLPKLKSGAILGGHDYLGTTEDGVTRAVNEFIGIGFNNIKIFNTTWIHIAG